MRMILSTMVILAALIATEASAQSINLTGVIDASKHVRRVLSAAPLSSPRTDPTSIFSTKPVRPPAHGLTGLRRRHEFGSTHGTKAPSIRRMA